MTTLPSLDHYALKSMDYGQLTGLAIACHAVPDCFLLMHVGVGCKNKATAHLLVHDWNEPANLREAWTEVGDADLILGASTRAGPYLRSWYKRMEPGLMVTTSVTFLELAGEDLEDEVATAAKDLPCPVLHIKAPGHQPDLYVGYAKLVLALMQQMDWQQAPSEARRVSLIGYLFDRYEGDHQGNLAEIGRLLQAVGLELGPSLLSGQPLDVLQQAPQSGLLVTLPYAKPIQRKLKKLLKRREVVATDLPMGLAGTSAWLRGVGAAAGVGGAVIDGVIEAEVASVRRRLNMVYDRVRSQSVAVVADLPLAVGLVSSLLELGLRPSLVALRGTKLGKEGQFREALDRLGLQLPDDTQLMMDPSLDGLRSALLDARQAGRLDGVFGASTDLHMVASLPSDVFFVEDRRGGRVPFGPFLVEVGFPTRDHHVLVPRPFMGFEGVVHLAQRILDAPRIWDGRVERGFEI